MALLTDATLGNFGSLPFLDENAASLTSVIHILCDGLQRGRLAEHKDKIVALLGSTLEGADSPVVLAVTLDYCCQWTSSQRSKPGFINPLARLDQVLLLNKLGALDRLHESAAQPLLIRMAILGSRLTELRSAAEKITESFPVSNSLEAVGLLCVWEDVRENCLETLRVSHGSKCSVLATLISEDDARDNVMGDLVGLLDTDLSALTSRHWGLLLIPSVLLNIIDTALSGRLCSPIHIHHGHEPVPTEIEIDTDLDAGHVGFRSLMDKHRSDTKPFLKALGQLSLSNVLTGGPLMQELLAQVWRCGDSDMTLRDMLTTSLSKCIARHQHRQVLCWPPQISLSMSLAPSSSTAAADNLALLHTSPQNGCSILLPLNVPQVRQYINIPT